MEEVIRSLKGAMDGGSAEAARQLGICYACGDGVPQDDRISTDYFRKGAEKGNPESMYRLFRNLSIGNGYAVNLDEADIWLKKAADLGHSTAMSTWTKYEHTGMLSKDLRSYFSGGNSGFDMRTIERISPDASLNPDKISVTKDFSFVEDHWTKEIATKSLYSVIFIYVIVGILCGVLLRAVYEKGICVMGSEVLIRSFSSSSNFTGFMIVIGETLILYIPLLFMPLIIVIISSLVMNLV